SESDIKEKAKEGQLAIEAKEGSKSVEGSSLPNEQRQKMKASVEGSVLGHSLCGRAVSLHESLIQG
ncbi:MAG: hypothetical protein ACI9JZ_002927, partial [Lentimonas sp.]